MAVPARTFHARARANRCEPGSFPDGCTLGADCSAEPRLVSARQSLLGAGSSWTAPKRETRGRRAPRANPDPDPARGNNEIRPSPTTRSMDQVQSGESRRPRKVRRALGKMLDL